MEYFSKNLKSLRKRAGMSQHEVSAKLGFKGTTRLSNYETGVSKPELDVIVKLGKIFKVTLDELIGTDLDNPRILNTAPALLSKHNDTVNSSQNIPLYSFEAAAGIVKLFRDNHPTKEYISVPNLPKCDGAIYVNGDSMYPLLKSGDIIMYKQIQDIANCTFVWGEMYLLSWMMDGDDFATVKWVQKSDNGKDWLKLVSQNQNHQPIDIKRSDVVALAIVKASVRINSMS